MTSKENMNKFHKIIGEIRQEYGYPPKKDLSNFRTTIEKTDETVYTINLREAPGSTFASSFFLIIDITEPTKYWIRGVNEITSREKTIDETDWEEWLVSAANVLITPENWLNMYKSTTRIKELKVTNTDNQQFHEKLLEILTSLKRPFWKIGSCFANDNVSASFRVRGTDDLDDFDASFISDSINYLMNKPIIWCHLNKRIFAIEQPVFKELSDLEKGYVALEVY